MYLNEQRDAARTTLLNFMVPVRRDQVENIKSLALIWYYFSQSPLMQATKLLILSKDLVYTTPLLQWLQ